MGIGKEDLRFTMGQNLLTRKKGFAIIPRGDYFKHEIYVSDDCIRDLTLSEKKILDLADLIIRGNFFVSRNN